MKEVNDKKESMKPMSQAAVELDDEALDQVSGGLKRLDSSWKPEITEVCKLWAPPETSVVVYAWHAKTNVNSKRKDKFKTVLCFHEKKQRQTIKGRM